jgi:hypothetical protein
MNTALFGLGLLAIRTAVASPDIIAGPIANPVNRHDYYLLSPATWTESEVKAIELGGHLVTINDDAEQAWVYDTFSGYGGVDRALWIGFSDAKVEGQFRWSSGESVLYSNWAPNEPNNSANQDYAHIYPPNAPNALGGLWNDIPNISSAVVQGVLFQYHGVVEVTKAVETALVYSNDFDTAAGPEWTTTNTDMDPAQSRRFLGPHVGGLTNAFMLGNLPPHTNVVMYFDLLVIKSWDGNGNVCCGPDILDIRENGSRSNAILHTSFSNTAGNRQSYPAMRPSGDNVPTSGASEVNSLGYGNVNSIGDSVYQMKLSFAHSADTLNLQFSLQSGGTQDEYWGIDNLRIYAGSSPTINLVTPAYHQSFSAPATISIEARVSPFKDDAITSVEFYADQDLLEVKTNAPFSTVWSNVSAGMYTIRVRAQTASGMWAEALAPISVNGLRAVYFSNTDLSGQAFTRIDRLINFQWNNTSPIPGIGNFFSARWTGSIVPLYTERYTFWTVNDDGVRLWINGQQLVDSWHSQVGSHTNETDLVEGVAYPIRLEFNNTVAPGAKIELHWASASQPGQIVPQSQLFPPVREKFIDFENLPNGQPMTELTEISNQWVSTHLIDFRLENGRPPRIAKRDNPDLLAFFNNEASQTSTNRPVPNQNVGDFYLTGFNGKTTGTNKPSPLVVSFLEPVSAASGVILDVDGTDIFTVEARDTDGNVLATNIVTASSANAGNASAAPWAFSRDMADIYSVRIEYTGPNASVGYAFDNFAIAEQAPGKLSWSRTDQSAFMRLGGTFGGEYDIEATDAIATDWHLIGHLTLSNAPEQDLMDLQPATTGNRFYRAKSAPIR